MSNLGVRASLSHWFRVARLGVRASGLEFVVWGLKFTVYHSGLRVQDSRGARREAY